MIIRRRHTANFTTISNRLFDDDRLAADEVGILAYLLSRPDNWEIRRPALGRRWGIGPVSIKRIVRSWMKAGWCNATKVRLPNGTFCILYDISDIPGKEMSEDEVREALSLVSSEASADDPNSGQPGYYHPYVPDDPPPRQPLLVDHPLATGGVAYRDITNTDQPRDESTKIDEMGEVAPARGQTAFTEGSKALAAAFWKALGFAGPLDIPPEFAGVDWRAIKWESAGWTIDLIDAEARRIAREKPLKPLSYFEKVFATSFAKRQTPLPVVEIRETDKLTVTSHARSAPGGNILQAADRLVDTIISFDRGASGPDEIRSGAGATDVRLLPKGRCE